MAISRSLMNRQLRASGGIMDVTPRENFGLGSSLKKFVRKIIPNEVADIAVKAAPFVAPFNPALAGVMGGLGTFDQTGSISSGLKSGAMNYGGGQLARYAGGAGFQGNPFGQGGAFTGGLQGFQGGFSSPIGTSTGLGKFFSKPNAPISKIQGVGAEPQSIEGFLSQDAAKNVGLESERLAELASQTQNQFIKNSPSAMDSFKSLISFDTSAVEKGNAALDLLKRGGQAAFTKPNPIAGGKPLIDKAAVMGAIAFAGSYMEAKALADDAGVELTEGAYDEARKTEKQAEYAGYLTNFFGGKKDGGRIGYGNGANEFMSEQMMLESNPGAAESGSPITIDTTMTGLINKYNTYKKSAPGVSEETRIFLKNDLLKSLEDAGISQEEFMMRLSEDTEMKANGGRIGFKKGSDPVYEMYLEDLEAGTIPSDKSYNEYLDDIEEDPDYDYSYAKGGRVNRRFGSPEEGERSGVMEMLAVDVDAGGDEEENMMMAYKPGSFYKKDFKPMEVDAINERLQSFLDGEGGGLPLPLINTVKGIANTLKAGKTVFTGPEKTTIIRNLAGRSRGTSAYKELGKSIPEAKRIMDNPINYLKDAAIFKELLKGIFKKDGGRIGYVKGGNRVSELLITRAGILAKDPDADVSDIDGEIFQLTGKTFKSIGGISEIPTGQPRLNQGGVAERDYRETGGFVPVGIKERADDVPAMLSKNEFVMTADSVRGLGNGSVEEGSKKLYNTMKQAEQKGKIA
jgi:hypothetical protein